MPATAIAGITITRPIRHNSKRCPYPLPPRLGYAAAPIPPPPDPRFRMLHPAPASVDATLALLQRQSYVADRSLATAIYLALKLRRPLFLEGEAGTGKTEIAKVLAAGLGRKLIRLQCYEGLDVASAVYEWNYARQMIEIRLAEAGGTSQHIARDVFDE